jgi:hypothetical protein
MGGMQKYPPSVEDAIVTALLAGQKVSAIYRKVLDGSLPGLNGRAWKMPRSSFYYLAKRARERTEGTSPDEDREPGWFIRQLAREEAEAEAFGVDPLEYHLEKNWSGPRSESAAQSEGGFTERQRVKERGDLVAEVEPIPDAKQDGPVQVVQSPVLNGRDQEGEREALLARLQTLIEEEEAKARNKPAGPGERVQTLRDFYGSDPT